MCELKENPFIEFGGIVNSVRDAVDDGSVVFYADGAHPDTLQRVDSQKPSGRNKAGSFSHMLLLSWLLLLAEEALDSAHFLHRHWYFC